MKNLSKLFLVMTIIISTINIAQANNNNGSRNGPPQRPSFDSVDTNGDGDIDLEEFSSQEIPHGDHQKIFDIIDTDNNGVISNEEFTSHKPPERKKR